jgi:hypothetical protein
VDLLPSDSEGWLLWNHPGKMINRRKDAMFGADYSVTNTKWIMLSSKEEIKIITPSPNPLSFINWSLPYNYWIVLILFQMIHLGSQFVLFNATLKFHVYVCVYVCMNTYVDHWYLWVHGSKDTAVKKPWMFGIHIVQCCSSEAWFITPVTLPSFCKRHTSFQEI